MEEQKKQFADIIKINILKNIELLDSKNIYETDKEVLNNLMFLNGDDVQLKKSLKTLSRCLYNNYHKKVII